MASNAGDDKNVSDFGEDLMFPTAVAFTVLLVSTLAVSNMLFKKKAWDPRGKVRAFV